MEKLEPKVILHFLPLELVLVECLFRQPVSGNAITPIAYTKPDIQLVAADGFTAVLAAGCPQWKKKQQPKTTTPKSKVFHIIANTICSTKHLLQLIARTGDRLAVFLAHLIFSSVGKVYSLCAC